MRGYSLCHNPVLGDAFENMGRLGHVVVNSGPKGGHSEGHSGHSGLPEEVGFEEEVLTRRWRDHPPARHRLRATPPVSTGFPGVYTTLLYPAQTTLPRYTLPRYTLLHTGWVCTRAGTPCGTARNDRSGPVPALGPGLPGRLINLLLPEPGLPHWLPRGGFYHGLWASWALAGLNRQKYSSGLQPASRHINYSSLAVQTGYN